MTLNFVCTDNVRDYIRVVLHTECYRKGGDQHLGGSGFTTLHSRANGRCERVGMEITQQATRRRALLHADVALLRILSGSEVQTRGPC